MATDIRSVGQKAVDDILHSGVKGMKWGVRKKVDSNGNAVSKDDIKWDKKLDKATIAAVKTTLRDAYPAVNKINNKPEYKNADLSTPGPLRDKYREEHRKAFETALNKELPNHIPSTSPSSKYKAELVVNELGGFPSLLVSPTASYLAQSSMKAPGVFKITTQSDDSGKLIGFDPMDDDIMAHGALAAENILAHFGIKGQKWGVRRSRKQLARQAGRDENDPRFMSDEQLRSKLNRMNMEKQYKEMTKAPPTVAQKGQKFVGKVLNKVVDQTATSITKSYADKFAANLLASNTLKGKAPSIPFPPPVGSKRFG